LSSQYKVESGMTTIEPFPWQVSSIEKIAAAVRRGLSILEASDMGTGKTITTLLGVKAADRRPAIVAPKSSLAQWRDICHRADVQPLFVLNIEALKANGRGWLLSEGGRAKNWRWTLPPGTALIFDEVQRFSAHNSQNALILACAPRPVVMASATCADSPIKMRAIGHQLGLCSWGNWLYWCGANGCQKNAFHGGLEFVGGPEILDRIHRQIFQTGRGVRVRIKDIPSYPENFIETMVVPVSAQKAIDEAYTIALKLEEERAPNAMVESLRARQLAEHHKIPALIEQIEMMVEERSVICFVNFRDSLSRLKDEFPEAALIYGGQSETERNAAITNFQNNSAEILITMIQAGGEALSLGDVTGTRPRVELINPGWSARELIQATARHHRVNSKSPALTYLVFAEGTIEERVRRKVIQKVHHIDSINDGLTDEDLRP
jgi:hypothetical protein